MPEAVSLWVSSPPRQWSFKYLPMIYYGWRDKLFDKLFVGRGLPRQSNRENIAVMA